MIGYGNQGRAQALNLRDSGVAVAVGLPAARGSATRRKPKASSHDVLEAAVGSADVVMMLAADENHGRIYAERSRRNLREGAALGFGHGLSIRFGLIQPRADLDVLLVAPKGPGTALRAITSRLGPDRPVRGGAGCERQGRATCSLLSPRRSAAAGSASCRRASPRKARPICSTSRPCSGARSRSLIHAGFETLVAAGFSPEIAYFECVSEVKLIADLIYARGIAGMREAISNTAEFGATIGGRRDRR